VGTFQVSMQLLQEGDPLVLRDFFSNFIILHAEILYYNNSIRYTASSDLFDNIKEGAVPPEYNIEIEKTMIDPDDIEFGFNIKFVVQKISVKTFYIEGHSALTPLNESKHMEDEKELEPEPQAYPTLQKFLT